MWITFVDNFEVGGSPTRRNPPVEPNSHVSSGYDPSSGDMRYRLGEVHAGELAGHVTLRRLTKRVGLGPLG